MKYDDPSTAAILALIAGDPIHSRDRELIVAAVLAEGREHGGEVDPNRLRTRLTGEHGLVVYPACIGATIQALRKAGVIEAHRWTVNTDSHGRNVGKPARVWKLVSSVEVAA